MEAQAARQSIREVIEDWTIRRDSGQFDRLAECWHDDGEMVTTWQRSSAVAFVAASRAAWERGVEVAHFLGGSAIDLAGGRAVAQTRMSIQQRGRIGEAVVDATCIGRFYDLFEQRDGRWAIVLRQPIYERDRLDALPGSVLPPLDAARLARFPSGYRHLAYLQSEAGMTVADDLPGLTGPAVDALYVRGQRWLEGQSCH